MLLVGGAAAVFFAAATAIEMATSDVTRARLTWSSNRGVELVAIPFVLVPIVVRSKLFGERDQLAPRHGARWAILDGVGRLVAIVGCGLVGVAAMRGEIALGAVGAAILVAGALCMRACYFTSRGG
jgi:hypothetical protein